MNAMQILDVIGYLLNKESGFSNEYMCISENAGKALT